MQINDIAVHVLEWTDCSCTCIRMELAEMKKLAEDRKRQKYEDRIARQKVKEQIARDREVQELQSKNKPTIPTQAQPTVEVKKDYTTCRLQVFKFGHSPIM